MPHDQDTQRNQRGGFKSSGSSRRGRTENEWVVVDSFTLDLMGDETCRVKERLLIAEYR